MAVASENFRNSPSSTYGDAHADTEALRAAHLANFYLRTALDQSENGVFIVQPQWDEVVGPKLLYSNSKMTLMTGTDPRLGMRGMFLKQLLTSDEDLSSLLKAMLQAAHMGGGSQWEGRLKTSFGCRHETCVWRIRAVQNDFGRVQNYTLTIAPSKNPSCGETDTFTHDHSSFEDDAKRLRTENLATMSQGVLHDLNNLLGIIMTNLSAIHLPSGGMVEPVQHHVQEALDAAAQARDFTTQTLRMAKDVPVTREAVAIARIIKEATRIAQSGSGVKLHMHVPQELWWTVADHSQIAQVMQNLVINGIQAMNNTGLMDVTARNVQAQQGHGLLKPGSYVEVVVRDRGCGMTPDILNKVLHEPYTTKDNGNGIGLSTCRRVIEEHGGRFYISSMAGVGTEVYFWLPATQKSQDYNPAKKHPGELVQGSGSVLVVDDEDRLRKVIVSVLKQCGYRVYEAPGGEEAIETYRRLMHMGDEVDLVIMDLTLKGGLSGEETMRHIKQLNTQAKIVASSGGLVAETAQNYLGIGFCDVLPKPYLAPDVAALVHKHVMKINRVPEIQAA